MSLAVPGQLWNPQMDIKRDPKQSSFKVPKTILPTVRQALYMRYISPNGNGFGQNSDYSISWIDEDDTGPCVPGIETSDSIDSVPKIPPGYIRTKVTVTSTITKRQLMKLTIHLTTGTIMVQGNQCPKWREEEFEKLVACVNYFASPKPPVSTYFLSLQVPVLVESPIRSSPRFRSVLFTDNTHPPCSSLDSVPMETVNDGQLSPAHCVGILPLPAPVIANSPSLPAMVEATGVAAVSDTSDTRGATAVTAPASPSPASETPDKHDATAVVATTDVASPSPSLLLPAMDEASTVADSDSPDTRDATTVSAATAPAPPSPSSKQAPTPDAPSTSDATATKPTTVSASPPPKSHPPPPCHCPHHGPLFSLQEVKDLITVAIADTETRVKKELKLDMHLTTQELNESTTLLTNRVCSLEKTNTDLNSLVKDLQKQVKGLQEKLSSKNTVTNPKQTTHETVVKPNVSTNNRFDVLEQNQELQPSQSSVNRKRPEAETASQQQTEAETASQQQLQTEAETASQQQLQTEAETVGQQQQQPESQIDANQQQQEHAARTGATQPQHLSPRELLAAKRVQHHTTHIILGDSISKTIKANLTFPGKNTENLSVGGLTLNDLCHWLANIPQSKQVKVVVLHIGINSCKSDHITKEKWSKCIRLVRKVFPSSKVYMCTLIPPRGTHFLKKAALDSNDELKSACLSEHCMIIDSMHIFTTQRGAPKQRLYRDALHPSPSGVAKLGCLIRDSVNDLPIQPASLDTVRPTSLGQPGSEPECPPVPRPYPSPPNPQPIRQSLTRPPPPYRPPTHSHPHFPPANAPTPPGAPTPWGHPALWPREEWLYRMASRPIAPYARFQPYSPHDTRMFNCPPDMPLGFDKRQYSETPGFFYRSTYV